MTFLSYIFPQTVETVRSKHNVEIKVIKTFGKYYLSAGGLMQSGGFLETVWKRGILKLKINNFKFQNILILGLGGGSFAKVISHMFPGAQITGVDIDPVIVDLGKKYLRLGEIEKLTIQIQDAQKFVNKNKQKYDLIFVDLYRGFDVPAFATKFSFIDMLLGFLTQDGIVIFNQLNFREYKKKSLRFIERLKGKYEQVKVAKMYSNFLVKIK